MPAAAPTGTRLTSKLLAIVAVSLIPAAALAALLIRPAATEVSAARRTAARSRPLVEINAFARAALDHRRAAADHVQSSGRVGKADVERRTEALEAALAKLERTAGEGGDAAQGEAAATRAAWEALKVDLDAWARSSNLEALWDKSATMMVRARRLTAEILGAPNRDVIAVLLDDADAASEAGLRCALAARAGRLERPAEARVQRLTSLLERDGDAFVSAYREATGRSRIESLTREQAQARGELLRRLDDVLRRPVEINEDAAPGLLRAVERVVELDLNLFEQFAELRVERFNGRASAANGRIALAIAAIAAGLAVTLLIAYLVARSLLRQTSAMHVALTRISAGDAGARAAVTSGDELGGLALTLNSALDARRASSRSNPDLQEVPSREVNWLARVIEDVADQASVQALNATLRASEAGATAKHVVAATQEVEALTERCAAAARQLVALGNQ